MTTAQKLTVVPFNARPRHARATGLYDRCGKRALDCVAAAFLLVLLTPLLVALAVVVRLDGGRSIYRHRRIGRHGRPFDCLKFRSMAVDADERLSELLRSCPDARRSWERFRKLENDPRVTRTGRWLRRSSLDELPQLLNVLRGDMSLVGPRPVTVDELAAEYAPRGAAHAYISVRPGLTGPWQVGGRSGVDYDQRVLLDLGYAADVSATRDLWILARTVPAVLARRGAT